MLAARHRSILCALALAAALAGASREAPLDAGYALELANASDVVVADLSFEAAPGTTASPSSIAVFAHGSKAKLVRIAATSKDGKDGAPGATSTNYNAAMLANDVAIRGKDGAGTMGGAQQDCNALCTNADKSTGGKGGNGTMTPTNGEAGKPDRGGGAAGIANGGCVGIGACGSASPATPASPARTALLERRQAR